MLSQKITQQSLSERSGIAQSTLSKLLRGDANFSLNQLVQLSNALGNNIFNTIASSDFNNIVSSASNSILELTENDNIILNTDRPAFRGYLNTISPIFFQQFLVSGKSSKEEYHFLKQHPNDAV